MKNIFFFFVLLIFAGAFLIFITNTDERSPDALATQPCKEPLTYRIGDVDTRFEISEQQITTIMGEVEELWETASESNLLAFDKDGRVEINLVYSKEQKRSEEEQEFSNQIKIRKEQAEATRSEYRRLSERFEQREKDLKGTVSQYNRLADSYNEFGKELQEENPSQDKIDELKKLETQINKMEADIERKQKNLESLRKQTNAKSKQLSGLVQEQNRMIARYNKQFGGVKRFDQGQFIKQGKSESIKVLQFSNPSELRTVLAHEIGHALGLNHVDNPKSVMYHKMGKQNIFDLKLSEEDVNAIKEQCSNQS